MPRSRPSTAPSGAASTCGAPAARASIRAISSGLLRPGSTPSRTSATVSVVEAITTLSGRNRPPAKS
jgi:hypothetical protein